MKPKHYNKLVKVYKRDGNIKIPLIEFSMQAASNQEAHDKGAEWVFTNINMDARKHLEIDIIDYTGGEEDAENETI